ncbi:MAG: DNA translocase FtsK 4TM domain-containing protein [Sphingomonadales bacterium]
MARTTKAHAAKNRSKTTLLPEQVAAFLKKRAVEAGGIALGVVALVVYLALISFHPEDPGWHNATSAAPQNWMGVPGAYVADILLQTLGSAAYLLVFPLVTWGWRIVTHRGLPLIGLQLLILPLAVLLLATGLAALPTAGWPVQAGAGGSLGLVLLRGFESLLLAVGLPLYVWIYAPVIGLLGLAGYLFALDVSRAEWSALGRSVRWAALLVVHRIALVLLFAWDRRPRRAPAAGSTPPRAPRRAAIGRKQPASTAKVEVTRKTTAPSLRAERERQPMLDFGSASGGFALPPLAILNKPDKATRGEQISSEALEQNARMLESVLEDFGVKGDIVTVRPGPVVTLYELEPAPGTKSARVIGLAHDIARSMSAVSARVAVVPGRNAIGIELPNRKREMVALRELVETAAFEKAGGRLTLVLGKDIGGEPVFADLASMPHLLVAGTTGSGKSVAINAMILSLLYRLPPDECRLIMIDPKMLELSVYDGIPHLLTPVVTEAKKAVVALKWAVREMEERYRGMSKLGVRNLKAYNKRLAEAAASGEDLKRRVQIGFDNESGEPVYEEEQLDLKPLPMIVVVVDEMADLMLVAGKDIEAAVQRLAQMARAAGIHLIMATQRPSVDVITGTIKANFPTRISFQVTSKIDSRTILGEQGAEQLLGQGDMLYMAGGGRVTRVHGPFVSDGEVEKVVEHLKKQGAPEYLEDITEEPEGGFDSPFLSDDGEGSSGDDLYDRAVAIVARDKKASTSYIQRQLQIGYNRAANLIDRMEQDGVIGPANHVGKREVLVSSHDD